MSEKQDRANLLSSTVDEIEVVNEDALSVDVRYDRSYGDKPAHTIRREAKQTAYSRVCKTKEGAWHAIEVYALEQLVLAEQAVRRWREAVDRLKKETAEVAEQTD
jgi:tryptophan 2,3-dioxygenase